MERQDAHMEEIGKTQTARGTKNGLKLRHDPMSARFGKSDAGKRSRLHRYDEWMRLQGTYVEVRLNGQVVRVGTVDAATSDSTMIWLSQDGVDKRILIDKVEGYNVWIDGQQLKDLQEMARQIQPSSPS